MFEDSGGGEFDAMTKGAEEASSAFAKLQGNLQLLSASLAKTGEGSAQIEAIAAALNALQTVLQATAGTAGEFAGASSTASGAVGQLNQSGSALVGVLQQIAASVQSSGLSALASNAEQTAKAFQEQKAAMTDSSSGLLGLITNVILYTSLAAAMYDTLRVIDGVLGGQNLKWDHLGGAINAAGQKMSSAGGGMRGVSALAGSLVGNLSGVGGTAVKAASGLTSLAGAGQLCAAGIRGVISLTGSLVSGLVGVVNSALASDAAMKTATTTGTLLGKSFTSLVFTGAGLGQALSGLLGLLKSVPRLIMLCAGAVQAFMVAAAPVLVPLLAIAAAIGAIILAWKALKALFTAGVAILKYLGVAIWEVAKAAYALGKKLAGYLYEGLKLVVAGIKEVVGWLITLYQRAREALLGALDRFSAALYAIIPALEGMAQALSDAAQKTGEFFDRMRNDSQLLSNTLLRLQLVFGKNADEAVRWAQSYSGAVGVAFADTARQVLTFTREFTKLNLTNDQARTLSQTMVQLGNDIASSLGRSPAGVMEALQSAISGNTDALYEYGIAVDKAAVEQKLLENGINPSAASAGQKALATLSVAAEKASFAYDHLKNNVGNYENQQRTLQTELRATSELLGGLLTQSHSKLTEVMIGGLRLIQRWIVANEELVKKLVDLPAILNAGAMVFKAMAIACSLAAGAVLLVSSALSILLSPLGLLTREYVKQSGVLEKLQNVYETAFGGAIQRMVQTALAARVAGVTISNWFTIGFLTAKAIAFEALGAIINKFLDLLGALPGLIRSFGGMEILGTTIGDAITRGILVAQRAFNNFGATAGSVINIMVAGFLNVYSVIRLAAVHAERLGKALAAAAAFNLGMFGAAFSLGKDVLDSSATDKAKQEIADLRKMLDKPFDVAGMRESAAKAQKEIDELDAGEKKNNPVIGALASTTEAANNAIKGVLGTTAAGMDAEAQKLKAQANALRDPNNPSNLSGGINLDEEMKTLMQQIQEAAKNNPLLDGFKNMFSEVLPQLQDQAQPKVSAQGSFGGQLQTETVSVQRRILDFQKKTADNTEKIANSSGLAVAGS